MRNLISVLLLGVAVFYGMEIVVGVGAAVSVNYNESQKYWSKSGSNLTQKAYEEMSYKLMCPAWKEQGLWGRYVTYHDRIWCGKYIDKI